MAGHCPTKCSFEFLPIVSSLDTSFCGICDGLQLFFESKMASDHVEDGSVPHLVFGVVAVELANDGELITH